MSNFEIKELHIKGMVCNRCISVVKQELENLGAEILDVRLGKAIIKFPKNKIKLVEIDKVLNPHDFALLLDEDIRIVEEIKNILIEIAGNLPIVLSMNISTILAEKMRKDYTSLSKLFSHLVGITIEKYFIQLKIEKAKELIQNKELNFTQIAYELGYSSVNYLSNQFKNTTGMSMSEYKKLSYMNRISIDKIS